ncbi:SGNH/GDSL hydrolase family protein [Candidatus Sumerlaeota bacterium]|nr:SGNH/GDSL hydrolase family protein [Candidatus Sumerlaeota bacterium]
MTDDIHPSPDKASAAREPSSGDAVRSPSARRLGRRGRLVFKLVLLAVSLLVALLLAEAGVRIVSPQPLAGIMYSDSAECGFWNLPNLRGKAFQSEPRLPRYRITTDSRGYRGARPVSVPKAPDTKRLVVLGDSFVFGVGVEDDQTFPAQTERLLNEGETGEPFEAVNAGCPGWGTENELAFWRARRRELDPDLLVVAFFRNDLGDNARHLLFQVRDGRLAFEPTRTMGRAKRIARLIPFYSFLSEHSHLVNLLRRSAVRFFLEPPPTDGPKSDEPDRGAAETRTPPTEAAPGENPALEERLRLFSLLMGALVDEARSEGIPVLVLLLPSMYDCVPGAFPDYGRVEEIVSRWKKGGRCESASLLDPIREARDRGEAIFQPRDGHYTPQGNEIVAIELARKVGEILSAKRDDCEGPR